MSTRVLSHRPSIPSLQTHNIASTSRNISPTPKRQQTSQHRTTSSRGSHRSRHQSPILSAESSTATTPDLSVKHTYMGDELFRMPDQDSSQPFPVSPTPKKGGNGKKGSNTGKRTDRRGGDGVQRSKLVSRLDIEMTHSNDDDSALFDLLGVASVDDLVSEEDVAKGSNPEPTAMPSTRPQRGILAISKADIEGEKRNKNQRKKKQAAQSDPERSPRQHSQFDSSTIDTLPNGKALLNSEREVYSEGEGKKKSTRKTKNNAKNDKGKESAHAKDVAVSGLSASRPMSRPTDTPSKPLSTGPHRHNDDDAFETASLSQSLPSNGALAGARGNLAKKSKNKKAANGKDESSVWEMPQDTGSGTQTLTWQQKLQTNPTDSPRRNKSAQSNNTPSAGDKKPRSRHNTANVPLPFPPSAMANSPFANNGSRPRHNRRVSADNIPISAFDDTLPFHTGLNVNRAPQTPAKLPTSMAPASVLPVLPGEFPRIGKSSQGPFSMPPAQVNGMGTPLGIKYAGPTFHNSPHAASLPKPDLDDF